MVVATYGRGIYRAKLLEGCYTGTTVYVNSGQTINTLKTICSNYTINNGGNLAISSQVVFANEASITVKSGGVLTIDGGVLINANINVESGGKLVVTNDGRIVLNSYDNLVINTGAIYEVWEGKITVRYTH